MKHSQAWSMDIMIALVIFIGTIFVFYSILSGNQGDKTEELEKDASTVAKNINITKNISQVDELLQEDYDELKKKLRVKNEFCIFLEDEEGNIVPINPKDADQLGIGSGEIMLGSENVPCTEIEK
jgi:hypothetical protein